MSCGNPHEVECTTVLEMVYLYIDDELDEIRRVEVVTHLKECYPCAGVFQVETTIKARVQVCCSGQAPQQLRVAIAEQLRQSLSGER